MINPNELEQEIIRMSQEIFIKYMFRNRYLINHDPIATCTIIFLQILRRFLVLIWYSTDYSSILSSKEQNATVDTVNTVRH